MHNTLVMSEPTITVFIKQISGKTTTLDVNVNIPIVELAKRVYEQRAEQHASMSILQYARAVIYIHGGRNLDWSGNLSDYPIQNLSTINEVAKSWTMGYNVDRENMTAMCPITLKNAKDPQILNCGHVFERQALTNYRNTGNNHCPICNK